MKKSQLSLVVSAVLLAGSGFANANEPVTLTDQQMDTVTAGFGFDTATNINLDKVIDVAINVTGNTDINVDPTVLGNVAVSNATADATGSSDTFTETFADAETTDDASYSAAEAVAITD